MDGLTADPVFTSPMLRRVRSAGVRDARVLAEMLRINRAAFIGDAALAPLAFEEAALPIACGQLMLHPSVAGQLLEALALPEAPVSRALLVGFGSGYLAALLAGLCGEVWAVDRYAAIVRDGEARLARLGVRNVTLRQADGLNGWPEPAVFDRIVLAGSVLRVPEALLGQLAPGGRLAAPVASGERCRIVSMTAEEEGPATEAAGPVSGLVRGIAAAL